MSDANVMIIQMLADGGINVDEAERLLQAANLSRRKLFGPRHHDRKETCIPPTVPTCFSGTTADRIM